MQQPSQLAASKLSLNNVLVCIKNIPRMEVAYINDIYDTISMDLDYAVTWWDDSQYRIHLRSLVSEQEWMQFKTEILRIYVEQNAKRAALRKLIQFNRYRPIKVLFLTLNNFKFYLIRCRCDPLRDWFNAEWRACFKLSIVGYLDI
eukprot:gene25822-33729_t